MTLYKRKICHFVINITKYLSIEALLMGCVGKCLVKTGQVKSWNNWFINQVIEGKIICNLHFVD